uniref:GDP-mannose transporter GONST4 n=1 Tax=Anthurium amnicola TaxID=1678845 RepID=A0A1D1YQF6_9ARAE
MPAVVNLDTSNKQQQQQHLTSTGGLVVGYALSSSLLAVVNKYAVTMFGYPALLTALQYATSALAVCLLGHLRLLSHDPFTYATSKRFLPAAAVFYLAIFTNTNLLRHANVDTFIVFRSLTPILVAAADTAFRAQPSPSNLTFASLLIILSGAVGYVATDSTFTLTAYSWAAAYLLAITTEMVYIKHVVTTLGLNTWGFVLYNNLLSLMIAPFFWVLTGEYAHLLEALDGGTSFDPAAALAVSLSCVFGLLISFFGFAARRAVSATAFTVTGVVNKFLTVAINVVIWDKHAGPAGLASLLLTIAGGVLYQQSVTRPGGGSASPPQQAAKVSELANVGAEDGDLEGGGGNQPGDDETSLLLPVSSKQEGK